MVVIFILAVAGLVWLANRVRVLLRLPVDSAMRLLPIPVPTVPLISVNKITDSSIFIHWDSYEEADADQDDNTEDLVYGNTISHFILYINGLETQTISGKQNSCTLQDLKPGSHYQIDLVCYNILGYKSRSSPIYVKTSSNSVLDTTDEGLAYPESVIRSLLNGDELKAMVKVEQTATRARSRAASVNENVTKNKNLSKPLAQNSVSNKQDDDNKSKNSNKLVPFKKHSHLPHLTTDINDLKWMLESALDEYNSIIKSYQNYAAEIKEEEATLCIDRDGAKKRKKYEDASKASLRQEIKLLEEQKLKTNIRFNKDEKRLEDKKAKIAKQKDQIETWKNEMETMAQKVESFKTEKPKKLSDLQSEIDQQKMVNESHHKRFASLENELKVALNDRKHLDNVKKQLETLINNLPNYFNPNTGLYNADGIEAIESIIKLMPTWGEQLRDELIIKDQNIFNAWKKEEDELIRNANQHQKFQIQQKEKEKEQELKRQQQQKLQGQLQEQLQEHLQQQHLQQQLLQQQQQQQQQPLQAQIHSQNILSVPINQSIPTTSMGHVMNPNPNQMSTSNSTSSQLPMQKVRYNASPDYQFTSLSSLDNTQHRRIPSTNSWGQSDVWSAPNVQVNNQSGIYNLFPNEPTFSSNVSPNISLNTFDYSTQSPPQQQQQQQIPQLTTSLSALSNTQQLMHQRSSGSLGPIRLDGLNNLSAPNSSAGMISSVGGGGAGVTGSGYPMYIDSSGRQRSGSRGTIWSNGNASTTNPSGLHNLLSNQLSSQLNMTENAPYYNNGSPSIHEQEPIEVHNDHHSTGSFSLKNTILKSFSPHKSSNANNNNNSHNNNNNGVNLSSDPIAVESGDYTEHKHSKSMSSNGSGSIVGSGNISNNSGSSSIWGSSRFFKMKKQPGNEYDNNAAATSDTGNVGSSGGSSGGGSTGRKLSLFSTKEKRLSSPALNHQ